MITTLSDYDSIAAAGVLARAGFAIEDNCNPAAQVKWPEEALLRRKIFIEARHILEIEDDDQSEEAIERLSDFLDTEMDRLSAPKNNEAVLDALSRKGELPSDLFNISISQSIQDFFGKEFPQEKKLIEETVRSPDREQNYGPSEDRSASFLISLFSKHFPNKFPYKSFTMIVAGKRIGQFLDIHQAWRLYSDSVSLEGADTLIEMLKRFSDTFGHPIEMGGKKANFILSAEIPRGQPIESVIRIEPEVDKKGRQLKANVTWTWFLQEKPFANSMQAALVISTDLIRYRKELEKHR